MTVNSPDNRQSHDGDGVTVLFAFSVYFLVDEDLLVYLRDANGVETLQTLNSDFTVTGAGDPAGGSITFIVSPPEAGSKVVIIRDPALTQQTDYKENDGFPAETHERALDKLTMQVQRLSDQLTRTIGLAETDEGTGLTLPSDRDNTLLGFDIAGEMEAVSKSTLSGATIPGTTLDRSITVFEGATGDAVQDTLITIDTSGNMFANNATGGITLPNGTTAQRPNWLINGALRYNTTLKQLEYYDLTVPNGGGWNGLASSGIKTRFNTPQAHERESIGYTASWTPDFLEGTRRAIQEMEVESGGVTVAPATNVAVDEIFTLHLKQDATTPGTIAFNVAYKNQPSAFPTAASKELIVNIRVTAVSGTTMTEGVMSVELNETV